MDVQVVRLERDARPHARLLERAVDRPAQRGAVVGGDQRLVLQVGEPHAPALREPVRRRADDHELLAEERDALGLGADLVRVEGRERQLDLVALEEAEHLGRRSLAQVDVDAGVRVREVLEQGGQVERAERRHAADGHAPAREPLQLVELVGDGVDLGEDAVGAGEDDLAGLGDLHAAAGAGEQLEAELGLEPAQLLRESGLGDVQLLARAGEVAVLRDRGEVAQLAQLHDAY